MEGKFFLALENDSNAELTLITLYDDYGSAQGTRTDHGFSCLVKCGGRKILFDTGTDSEILLSNMEKLGIKPEEIDSIVLSHFHYDHTGGLFGVLEKNSDLTVFLPESFPAEFKERVKSYGASIVEVGEPIKIYEGVLSTGELDAYYKNLPFREQSLLVKTSKGLVIVTGCAHPGIVEIIEKARDLTGKEVFLVIGGFHLLSKTEPELHSIIKKFRELGVKKVAPSHCSGDLTRRLFEEEYGEDFISNGVGKVIRT